jgi:hypothetical protein
MIGIIQVRQIWITRNKVTTIRNAIILFLTFSALLRIFFWVKVSLPTELSPEIIMIIYYLPVWLDFAGLSLLAVFYAETLLKASPNLNLSYKNYPLRICIFFNSIFLGVCLTIGILITDDDVDPSMQKFVNSLFSIYASFLDFLLSTMLSYFGYKFYTNYSNKNLTTRILPRSLKTFASINWYIVIAYIVRGFFTIAVGQTKLIPITQGSVVYEGSHQVTGVGIMCFYLVTEWTPSILVIFLLWRRVIPRKRIKQFSHEDNSNNIDYDPADESLKIRLMSVEDTKISVYYDGKSSKEENNADLNSHVNKNVLTSRVSDHSATSEVSFDDEYDDYVIFHESRRHTQAEAIVIAQEHRKSLEESDDLSPNIYNTHATQQQASILPPSSGALNFPNPIRGAVVGFLPRPKGMGVPPLAGTSVGSSTTLSSSSTSKACPSPNIDVHHNMLYANNISREQSPAIGNMGATPSPGTTPSYYEKYAAPSLSAQVMHHSHHSLLGSGNIVNRHLPSQQPQLNDISTDDQDSSSYTKETILQRQQNHQQSFYNVYSTSSPTPINPIKKSLSTSNLTRNNNNNNNNKNESNLS